MSVSPKYPRLMAEGRIGSVVLRNRIVMPPMATNFAQENGEATERLIRYLERRACGGVGLIIVEGAYVSADGKGFSGQVGAHHDGVIPGLARLTRAVREAGARVALQLMHSGRQTRSAVTGCPIVGPSAVPCPAVQETPAALSRETILRIVDDFGQAARRAKEAGFDAVELHGAHGYLLHQFLSPLSNRRKDEYGGSKENQVRFAREVVGAVRNAVGPDYPILFRIDAEEFIEGGIDLPLARYYCETLAPRVDALHVSAGSYGARAWIVQPYFHEAGLLAPLAGEIKKAVRIPVIAVGRIHSPELAEKVLARGDADFIAIGRGLLADPDLPLKARQGTEEEIMPCLSCYVGCIDRLKKDQDISCVVNPFLGREHCKPTPLNGRPRCLIIGAGPAGMSAAAVLAERGARVTLVEKRAAAGGQFLWAARVNFKQPFERVVRLYRKKLEQLGVEWVWREAAPEWVKEQRADRIILATGSVPFIPPLPGLGSIPYATFGEALDQGVREEKVLIVGGGATGCEMAELLLSRGKKVIVVEMLETLAADMGNTGPLLLDRLSQMGVEAYTGARVEEIKEGQVTLHQNGKTVLLEGIEGLILACGVRPNNILEKELRDMGLEVTAVGDCQEPRNGFWAVRAGFELGMALA